MTILAQKFSLVKRRLLSQNLWVTSDWPFSKVPRELKQLHRQIITQVIQVTVLDKPFQVPSIYLCLIFSRLDKHLNLQENLEQYLNCEIDRKKLKKQIFFNFDARKTNRMTHMAFRLQQINNNLLQDKEINAISGPNPLLWPMEKLFQLIPGFQYVMKKIKNL